MSTQNNSETFEFNLSSSKPDFTGSNHVRTTRVRDDVGWLPAEPIRSTTYKVDFTPSTAELRDDPVRMNSERNDKEWFRIGLALSHNETVAGLSEEEEIYATKYFDSYACLIPQKDVMIATLDKTFEPHRFSNTIPSNGQGTYTPGSSTKMGFNAVVPTGNPDEATESRSRYATITKLNTATGRKLRG
ncbi:uncharacterized protein L199_004330 [Kwoniella botswanensis]|uniref:uncharacterized protein n=1 Tax=Kwoniella botswanensis TaxID=1268659 RepID=UPI00315CBBE4